jgi:hypothetical protein
VKTSANSIAQFKQAFEKISDMFGQKNTPEETKNPEERICDPYQETAQRRAKRETIHLYEVNRQSAHETH